MRVLRGLGFKCWAYVQGVGLRGFLSWEMCFAVWGLEKRRDPELCRPIFRKPSTVNVGVGWLGS